MQLPASTEASAFTVVFTGSSAVYQALQSWLKALPPARGLEAAGIQLRWLPLMELQLHDDPGQLQSMMLWLQSRLPASGQQLSDLPDLRTASLVGVVFSQTSVMALHGLLEPDVLAAVAASSYWFVPGKKTAVAVQALLGIHPAQCQVSPAAQSAEIARTVIAAVRAGDLDPDRLFILQTEKGRPEFKTTLASAGFHPPVWDLYTSLVRNPAAHEYRQIPDGAWIILGSPRIARAFLDHSNRYAASRSWNYAVPGQTTAAEVTQILGRPPRIIGPPDYQELLAAIICSAAYPEKQN
ncbi:MAG: uroporphyrinogen-III synthase [Leptospiraceae bacterium]|nr:uroporphyrinogen-III synthase [Leptospiraceae bacterium]